MGRSKKQKVELGGSAVTEHLTVDGHSFSYQQLEGSFSQPNAGEAFGKSWLENLPALSTVSAWACIRLHPHTIVWLQKHVGDTMGNRRQIIPILSRLLEWFMLARSKLKQTILAGWLCLAHMMASCSAFKAQFGMVAACSLQHLLALPAVRSRPCMGMSGCHLKSTPSLS